eukprot:TRINITY_DN24776_c0_g1_i1.p1 TRINITY_DN24776_c0_g1~~TRINITY_DN24776_c0_g1_i1.p1  ORF type:complete len:103 (+),score=1.40 TRINITY_DN24776_c0_g1_i1:48-311(+)
MARKEGVHCEPLENSAITVSLKLARNSVRKARWYKKLGFQKGYRFRVSLRSIECNGGSLPFIYVCVTRKYCTQFSIKMGDAKGKYII